jgi:predicted nucleotidyltransferase
VCPGEGFPPAGKDPLMILDLSPSLNLMIRYSKLPDNILSLLPKGITYLQSRKDVFFAYLFGSLAKGRIAPLSDVDIAIYLSEEIGLGIKKMEILGGLMECLQTDEIDLVLLNRAPVTLRMKILENKTVIVDKAPFIRHQYESLAMREYFDFSIKERAILERRFLHGR